jgi:hypothetical protein
MTASIPGLGTDERQLLLSLGRLTLDPEPRAEAYRVLRKPLSWDAILFHARLHSVASLVYHNLDRLGAWESVPEAARRQLLRLWHRAGYQNLIFARENATLLRAFGRLGVPVIVHKGISLVERIYGSAPLRPLIDLVFMVPSDRIRDATHALRESGYEERRLSARETVYRWSCPQHYFVAERAMTVAVLLQSDFVNWPRIHRFAAPPLWERSRPELISGERARVLSPVDQLLYLCLQADNHGTFNRVAVRSASAADLLFTEWTNNRQIRFTDIFEVARHYGEAIDWDVLARRAREGAIEEPVFTSLTMTNRLLGPVAECAALEQLRVDGRNRLRRWLYHAVTQPVGASTSRSRARVRAAWLHLPPRSQLQVGRIIGLIEVCFPEPKQLGVCYGVESRVLLPPLFVLHATRGVIRSALAYSGRRLSNVIARVRGAIRRRVPAMARQGARA